jgi:hypothetical protein
MFINKNRRNRDIAFKNTFDRGIENQMTTSDNTIGKVTNPYRSTSGLRLRKGIQNENIDKSYICGENINLERTESI